MQLPYPIIFDRNWIVELLGMGVDISLATNHEVVFGLREPLAATQTIEKCFSNPNLEIRTATSLRDTHHLRWGGRNPPPQVMGFPAGRSRLDIQNRISKQTYQWVGWLPRAHEVMELQAEPHVHCVPVARIVLGTSSRRPRIRNMLACSSKLKGTLK